MENQKPREQGVGKCPYCGGVFYYSALTPHRQTCPTKGTRIDRRRPQAERGAAGKRSIVPHEVTNGQ